MRGEKGVAQRCELESYHLNFGLFRGACDGLRGGVGKLFEGEREHRIDKLKKASWGVTRLIASRVRSVDALNRDGGSPLIALLMWKVEFGLYGLKKGPPYRNFDLSQNRCRI